MQIIELEICLERFRSVNILLSILLCLCVQRTRVKWMRSAVRTHSFTLSRCLLTCFRAVYRKTHFHHACVRLLVRRLVGVFVAIARANMNFHNCFMPKAFISLSTHNKIRVRTTQHAKNGCLCSVHRGRMICCGCFRPTEIKLRKSDCRHSPRDDFNSIGRKTHTASEWGAVRHTPPYTTRAYGFETNARETDLQLHIFHIAVIREAPLAQKEKLKRLIWMPVHRIPSTCNVLLFGMVLPFVFRIEFCF